MSQARPDVKGVREVILALSCEATTSRATANRANMEGMAQIAEDLLAQRARLLDLAEQLELAIKAGGNPHRDEKPKKSKRKSRAT